MVWWTGKEPKVQCRGTTVPFQIPVFLHQGTITWCLDTSITVSLSASSICAVPRATLLLSSLYIQLATCTWRCRSSIQTAQQHRLICTLLHSEVRLLLKRESLDVSWQRSRAFHISVAELLYPGPCKVQTWSRLHSVNGAGISCTWTTARNGWSQSGTCAAPPWRYMRAGCQATKQTKLFGFVRWWHGIW